MKRILALIFMVVIVAAACSSNAVSENQESEAVKTVRALIGEFSKPLGQWDWQSIEYLTCKEGDRSKLLAEYSSSFIDILLAGNVCQTSDCGNLQVEFTQLELTERDKNSQTAVVHLKGTWVIKTPSGIVEDTETHRDLDIEVVIEDDKWRVCGNVLDDITIIY